MDGQNMLPKCRSGWDGRAEHPTKVSQMAGLDGRNMLLKSGAEVEQNRCEGGEKSAEIARKAAKIE